MSAFDYYEVLGVEDPKISQEELKKAYNKARREAHPDAPKGNPMLFRMVEEAWKALGTPDARTLYDQSLKTPASPPQPPKAPTQPPQAPAAPARRPGRARSCHIAFGYNYSGYARLFPPDSSRFAGRN